jgi:uncharacterized protein
MKYPELFNGTMIRTVSGRMVDVFNPKPSMFDINDIAHSLAHQCRFGGHMPVFYSVAQHSFHVSRRLPDKHKLAGLMHDAAESYVLDMPKPIKNGLLNYKQIENGILKCLAEKFNFQFPLHESVKIADENMLIIEYENLILGLKTHPMEPMAPQIAKQYFLNQFNELTK